MQDQELIEMLKRQPSPHEATGMADLIEPFQIELIKDFCRRLRTKPQAETAVMFGEVSFYRLSKRAADALTVALANAYRQTADYALLKAWQATYDAHNAPDHDQTQCDLCMTHRPELRNKP